MYGALTVGAIVIILLLTGLIAWIMHTRALGKRREYKRLLRRHAAAVAALTQVRAAVREHSILDHTLVAAIQPILDEFDRVTHRQLSSEDL